MTDLIALPHRALIALTGPDWGKFLNGQTTIDAEKIFDAVTDGTQSPLYFGPLYYGAFLTPQGKLSGDVFICPRDSDTVWIDVDAGLRDELFTKLNMFKLRAKVALSKPDAQVYASFSPNRSDALPDPRAPGLFRAYGVFEATGSIDAYDQFRLTQGLAEPGLDFPKDYLYPIDINMDLIDAIDFKKGCFVGQETTSRMKRRGTIKNRLIPLTHAGRFDFGTEVLLGERRAGEILASLDGRSLALMRLDRIDGDLTCNGEAVALAVPGWLRPTLAPVES